MLGSTPAAAISEKPIAVVVTAPNRRTAGRAEVMGTPKRAVVVSSEPKSAPPVYPAVDHIAASGSLLMEVGNAERNVFIFDVGAGSLANFSAPKVPVTSLAKVFLPHLHVDHIADFTSLVGGYTRSGRLDPVEVWGEELERAYVGYGCIRRGYRSSPHVGHRLRERLLAHQRGNDPRH